MEGAAPSAPRIGLGLEFKRFRRSGTLQGGFGSWEATMVGEPRIGTMNRGESPHPVPHTRNPGVWPFLAGCRHVRRHETAQGDALIVLHTVRGGHFPIPKGLRPKAQGCEERATLGGIAESPTTPTGLRPGGATPLGLMH